MRTDINTVEKCLTPDEMSDYLGHRLTGAQETLVDLHLQDCVLCVGALEAVERSSVPVENRLETLKMREREFKDVLKRVERQNAVFAFRWLKYAAVVIVILLPAYLVYNSFFSLDNDALVARYFEPYEDMISTRAGEPLFPELADAMASYNSADYSHAAEEFEKALQRDGQNDLVRLYAGIAYLQAGENARAKACFEDIAWGEGMVTYQARWYLALTYLKMKKDRDAVGILKGLSSEENPYREKAGELLRLI